MILRLVPNRAPARMIAILLAPAGVAAGRLNVAAGMRADPDVRPCRRYRQRPDARQRFALRDPRSVRAAVTEALAGLAPADPRTVVADVAQARLTGHRRAVGRRAACIGRSEEHTSELQSLM